MRSDEMPFTHPWEQGPISQYADVIVGGTPSTDVPAFWGGEVKWMASGDIHGGHLDDVSGRITEAGLNASAAKIVQPPAVAIALAGQGKTRGTVALVHVPLSTNQSVALIKPRGGQLLAEFLYQSLIPRYEELRGRSSGGGRAGLTKSIIEVTPIQRPPLGIQHSIAAILATIDAVISDSQALIEKLVGVGIGIASDIFDRVEALASETAKTPGTWHLKAVGEVFRVNVGYVGPVEKYFTSPEDGIPLVSTANIDALGFSRDIANYVTHAFDRANRKSSVQPGDLLVARHGRSGSVVRVPDDITQAQCMNVVVVRGEGLIVRLLEQYLRTPVGRKRLLQSSAGSVQGVVSTTAISRFAIPVPDGAGEAESVLGPIDAVNNRIEIERDFLRKLTQMRIGLADDLLTGRVSVQARVADV